MFNNKYLRFFHGCRITNVLIIFRYMIEVETIIHQKFRQGPLFYIRKLWGSKFMINDYGFLSAARTGEVDRPLLYKIMASGLFIWIAP